MAPLYVAVYFQPGGGEGVLQCASLALPSPTPTLPVRKSGEDQLGPKEKANRAPAARANKSRMVINGKVQGRSRVSLRIWAPLCLCCPRPSEKKKKSEKKEKKTKSKKRSLDRLFTP